MAAMSHGGSLLVTRVVCVLCTVKLDEPNSRINVCGRSSFPVEIEIRKLPINVPIDEETRICVPCLPKLKKRKSLEENLESATEELVRTYSKSCAVKPDDFSPSCASTPAKAKQPTTCTSSMQRTCFPPQTTTAPKEPRQIEPGVTVSW